MRQSIKARTAELDPGFPRQLFHKHGVMVTSITRMSPWVGGKELVPVVRDLTSIAEAELHEGLQVMRQLKSKAISNMFLDTVAKASCYLLSW